MSAMTYIDDLAARIQAEVPADLLPDADVSTLFRLYALLALSKGRAVEARDVHDAWAVWMLGRDESHRSLVPFDELPRDVQRQDEPFVKAIRRVAGLSQP